MQCLPLALCIQHAGAENIRGKSKCMQYAAPAHCVVHGKWHGGVEHFEYGGECLQYEAPVHCPVHGMWHGGAENMRSERE